MSSSRLIHHLLAPASERVAVSFQGESLTYRELHARSNRLARHLRRLGVGPEVVVGLYMSRCLAQMVSLLAVLKAGGAYVPLDPQYPKDRLDHMRDDSGAAWLIVPEGEHAGRTGGREVVYRSGANAWDGEPDTAPEVPDLTDRNLAHLLYTSGSTGKPKGVEIEHASVVNFLESMDEILALTADDVLLSVTGLTFDIAGLDIYLSWMKGIHQVLVPRPVVLDGQLLARALEDSRATFLQTTPVTWRGLLDAGWRAPAGFKGICGGEMLPRTLADDFARQSFRLWNMYGPTETTIWSTACELTPGMLGRPGPVSAGWPIRNTTIRIVDGEVCIGGAGLARGYHGLPDLTADRFVVVGGERVYRTGDAGALEVEPGEIEVAIRNVAGVSESLVVLKTVRGEAALVAYLVAPPGAAPDLRDRLAAVLPAYMVPAHVVHLSSFPQTPNGKVDRKALPEVSP